MGANNSKRLRLVLFGTGCFLLALAVAYAVQLFRSHAKVPSTPDPRRDYAGPYQNVGPAVRYVSDERCAECHQEKAHDFAQQPMGRSLFAAAQAPSPPEDAQHNDPFDALGSRFLAFREGGRVLQRRTQLDSQGRPAAKLDWHVDYVLGSGHQGHSYLSNHDGYLFQTPLSWYTQKKAWDLSPGFSKPILVGRAVAPECLFCHTNRANHVEGTVNRYAEPVFEGVAIGCQRCHGPGELHVASRSKPAESRAENSSEPDYTIVNPSHLERPLREAVCEQCHLQGRTRLLRRGRGLYDFRPGLPLDQFWSVFVNAPDVKEGQKAVGHVEQMYQSRCFEASSAGSLPLGCITCHNPHKPVPAEQRVAYFRNRCFTCHRDDTPGQQPGDKGIGRPVDQERRHVASAAACSFSTEERQKKGDSCIDCHMPRYGSADIPHTASTDHRILRPGPVPAPDPTKIYSDNFPVYSFYHARKETFNSEDDRDRAVALVRLALLGESSERFIGRALASLESALGRDQHDPIAGIAKGHALETQGRLAEALAAFQAVLAEAPEREPALVAAAALAESLRQMDQAEDYWRRAIAVDPWAADYHGHVARLLVRQEAWDKARPECEAWSRLDPMSTEARTALVECLLAAGKKEEARAEFARIEALAPSNLHELQLRFLKKLK